LLSDLLHIVHFGWEGGVHGGGGDAAWTSCAYLGQRPSTLYVDSGVSRSLSGAFKVDRVHDNICVHRVWVHYTTLRHYYQ